MQGWGRESVVPGRTRANAAAAHPQLLRLLRWQGGMRRAATRPGPTGRLCGFCLLVKALSLPRTYAVVRAQGGAICTQPPIAAELQLDGVGCEVVC